MELHSFRSGAFLPAAQASLSGLFFSLVVAGIAWWTGAVKPGVFLLLGGACVAFIAWCLLLRHWLRLVDHSVGFQVQHIEVVDQVPTFQPSVCKVELLEQAEGAWRGEYLNLPCAPEQLKLLASGVMSGGSLSESGWCGANRPFTKSQFHQLRQALIEKGWLAWRSPSAPAQGVEVTHVGRRVFSYLSEGNHYLPTGTPEDW